MSSSETQKTTVPKPVSCMPARCARSSARRPRRCSSPRATSIDSAEECEARFNGKEPGYVYSRYSQSDRDDVRAAHGRARRRRGRARHRDRHGRRHHRADGPGQGRRSRRRRQGAVRLLPLGDRGLAAALRRHLDAGRRQRPRRNGGTRSRPNTKAFFLETPTNPTLEVYDIAAVAEIAHAAGAKLVVDNVFATPLYQSPLALGADCVVYSATKHIDGQGRVLGGVHPRRRRNSSRTTCTRSSARPGRRCRRSMPGCCSRASRRLSVRVQRQTETAAAVSVALAGHPKISRLIYPGQSRSSAGRHRAQADARRLNAGGVRGQGRQGRRVPLPGRAARSSASPTISATPRAWSPIRRPRRISG